MLLTGHLRRTKAPKNHNYLTLNTGSGFTTWSSIWAIKSRLTVRTMTASCQEMRVSQESWKPCQESWKLCRIRSQAKQPGLRGLSDGSGKCTLTCLLSNYFCHCQRLRNKGKNLEILLGQSLNVARKKVMQLAVIHSTGKRCSCG